MTLEVTREILTNARAYVAFWMIRAGYEVTHRGLVQEKGSDGRVMQLPIHSVLPLDYADDLRKYSEQAHEHGPSPKEDPANWLPPEDTHPKEIIDPETGHVFVAKRGPGRPRKGWKYIGPPKGGPGRPSTHNVKALSESLLLHAFTEHVHRAMLAERERFVYTLVCEEENLEPLQTFVRAILPRDVEESIFEMNVAVLSHWIWQVKKKMKGENPIWHIMPILCGKGGSGKSLAVEKYLLSPISAYVISANLNELTDSRFTRSLSENFVAYCEELAGARTTDMNSLKALITANTQDYRPLGKNDVVKVQQACSLIGCSNESVHEQIKDKTGNRRFFQIDCPDKLDWPVFDTIDYMELWRGVDEKREDGYIKPFLALVQQKQSTERYLSSPEEFLLERAKDSALSWERMIVYAGYGAWCEERGHRRVNEREFQADARRAGWTLNQGGRYENSKR